MADESIRPVIRNMIHKDLDRMVEIDVKVLGEARPQYWEMKLALAEKHILLSLLDLIHILGQISAS